MTVVDLIRTHPALSPDDKARLIEALSKAEELLLRMKASIECLPWEARRPQLDAFLKMIDEALAETEPKEAKSSGR